MNPDESELDKDTNVSEETEERKPGEATANGEEKTNTKEEARERSKQGILEAYERRLTAGEVQEGEVPKWIMNELRPKREEQETEKRFEEMLSSLQGRNLTEEEKLKVESGFNQLRGYGVPKDVALRQASLELGTETREQVLAAQREGLRLGRMIVPPAGTRKTEADSKVKKAVRSALEKNDPSVLTALQGKDFQEAWRKFGEGLRK